MQVLSVYPCGVILDFLRTPYESTMRFWDAPEIEPVAVQWVPAPPGATWFVGENAFMSRQNFDPHEWHGIGEQRHEDLCYPQKKGEFYSAKPIPELGRKVCGSPLTWERGGIAGVTPPITTQPGGGAACCGKLTVGQGGLSLGGSSYGPPTFAPVLAWAFGTLGGGASVDLSAAPDAPGRIYLWLADTALMGGIFALPGGFTVLQSSVVPGEISLIVAYKDVPSVRGVYTVPGAPDIQPLVAAGAFPFVPVQVGVLPARGSGPAAFAPDVYVPTAPGWQVSYFLSFETANVIFTDPSTDSVGGSGEQGSMVLAILLQLASGTLPGENALIQPTPGPWIAASLGIGT